jgi:hypothetical protein
LLRRAKSGILWPLLEPGASSTGEALLLEQGPLREAFLLAQGMSALPMFGCETTADYGKASRPFFISGTGKGASMDRCRLILRSETNA